MTDINKRETTPELMARLHGTVIVSPVKLIKALEFRRLQYDLTQRDFAAVLGLTPGNYGEILAGRRRLPLTATKRAYAIGVPADVLLGDQVVTMKLYEVKPKQWVKVAGERIYFDHLDGMYSFCLDEGGNPVHIAASQEVELDNEEPNAA